MDNTILQIFLKRMPAEHLTDKNRGGFESAAKQAVEIAALLERAVAAASAQTVSVHEILPGDEL